MSSSFSMLIDDFHNGPAVPLVPVARAGMPTLPYVEGNSWVITGNRPVSTDPPSATVAAHPWRAGLKDGRIHDFWHSFASQAAMQGIPLPVVARLLGHAQVQMTLRYAHVSDRDVEAAAERIGRVMAGIMDRPCFRPEPTP